MTNWKKLANNIPTKVKIGSGVYYEVLFIKEFLNDSEQTGETRFQERQIILKQGLSKKTTIISLFHEVLHAASAHHEAQLTESQVFKMEDSFDCFYNLIKELDE